MFEKLKMTEALLQTEIMNMGLETSGTASRLDRGAVCSLAEDTCHALTCYSGP